MIIKQPANIEQQSEYFEDLILKICSDAYIDDLQFNYPYEPEIKLNIFYNYLKERNDDTAKGHRQPSKRLEKLFIQSVLNLLRRIPPTLDNFDIVYRIILFLNIVVPSGINRTIRSFIYDATFINMTSPVDKFNLHLELINLFMTLLTEEEEIDFMNNYLESELNRERLMVLPNFVAVFLRFFIKFRIGDYFLALESILPKIETTEQTFRLTISINEYIKARKTYKDLLAWLQEKFSVLNNAARSASDELIISSLKDLVVRKKRTDESKYLLLLEAELALVENNSLKEVITFLSEFCKSKWKNKLEEKTFKTEFQSFLVNLTRRGYVINEPDEFEGEVVVFIEPARRSRKQKVDEAFEERQKTEFLIIPSFFYKGLIEVL